MKIKEGFTASQLEELGYTLDMLEGGYISQDGATIVSMHRTPYQQEVMQYLPLSEEHHEKNLERLREVGAIEIEKENHEIEKERNEVGSWHSFGKVVYKKQGDEDVVILCVLGSDGLKPVKALLPHQVYEEVVENMKKEYPNHAIMAIPVKSDTYVDLYTPEKWE